MNHWKKVTYHKWRPWHVIWHFVAGLWFEYPFCCIMQFCTIFMLYPITGRILLARMESRAGFNECYYHRRKNPL